MPRPVPCRDIIRDRVARVLWPLGVASSWCWNVTEKIFTTVIPWLPLLLPIIAHVLGWTTVRDVLLVPTGVFMVVGLGLMWAAVGLRAVHVVLRVIAEASIMIARLVGGTVAWLCALPWYLLGGKGTGVTADAAELSLIWLRATLEPIDLSRARATSDTISVVVYALGSGGFLARLRVWVCAPVWAMRAAWPHRVGWGIYGASQQVAP